jgi:DNA-binding NarL/FixJ family response regulator
MSSKTVVVVEDREAQRIGMVYALERRGFRARGAATVAEARQAIEELREEIDVMVLDMLLEDPAAINVTGADIGIQLQAEHPTWMPEYFIQSAHSKVNYYQLALRLGAATYLPKLKGEVDISEVIRHVRALALRRALRLERPQVADRLGAIYDSTKNLSTAVKVFCRDILKSEFDACLGAPYVLLLTDESGTHNFVTNTNLPLGHESIYTTLQAMAHGISNFSSPYEVTAEELRKLPKPVNENERRVHERLAGAAFIPLANIQFFRLSLGLLEPLSGEVLLEPLPRKVEFPEDTGKLAAVLAQYVRSTIVEHVLRILVHLDSQKRAMLKGTSRFCVFLGQDQQSIVEEGIANLDLKEGSETHYKLTNLADDLWDTGTILTNVANSDLKLNHPPLELRSLVDQAFQDLKETMHFPSVKFSIEGDCTIRAKSDDIYIALIRVLQWLVQRRIETPPETEQEIRVRCVSADNASQVIFEDQSLRLASKVREQLFMPFSISAVTPVGTKSLGPGLYLPLFLAKMLVEEKYGGGLDDRSDELEGEIGHRLVMSFPTPNRQQGKVNPRA